MTSRTSGLVRRLALPGTALLAALLLTGCQDTPGATPPTRTATTTTTASPTPTPTPTSTPTASPSPTASTPRPVAPPPRTGEKPAPKRSSTRVQESAPEPRAPKRTKAPAPAPAPAEGAILSPSGKHYKAGQFCPKRLRGQSTVDANGTRISCYAAPGDRLRWH
ncbi:hypothetical protein ACFYVL_39490 [Streptomyces sp. NPDC004111]|uniref:hypothetical protein n=1 Tax=Streptomyces sp. NPDC004111 TaxID=3364690 RepID=UPI00369AB1BB